MKTALIYPPFMDPRAPQLALPSLAAFLRANDVTVTMYDLAIDGLLWMTEPEQLERSRRALAATADRSEIARDLLLPFDRAIDLTPWSLASLRDPAAFFDAQDFNAARDVLSCIVRAHSVAADDRMRCNLHPIMYHVKGINSSRFRDLVEVTGNPGLDLFHELYTG